MKHTLLILVMLTAGCSSKVIIRDSKAYRLEAFFFKQSISGQQDALRPLLHNACCEDGVYRSTPECSSDGETYAVVHARAQHHYDRMMYLAGYQDNDPGAAPQVDVAAILEEMCRD
jgi:hypothetical protein